MFYCYTLVDFLHRSARNIRYRYLNWMFDQPMDSSIRRRLCLRNSHCNNSAGICSDSPCRHEPSLYLIQLWSKCDCFVLCRLWCTRREVQKLDQEHTFLQILGFLQAFKDQIYTPAVQKHRPTPLQLSQPTRNLGSPTIAGLPRLSAASTAACAVVLFPETRRAPFLKRGRRGG